MIQGALITYVLLLALLVSACGPRARTSDSTRWPAVDVQDEASYPLGAYGGLQHNLRISSSEGRTLRLRGWIHNPYAESVDGVRVVVQILASGAPEARVLESHQIEFAEIDLVAGADTSISRSIQTMYTSTKSIRIAVFAIQRDGSASAPPPEDLKDAQTVQLSTGGAPIPESMVGNIFSGF